VGKKGTAGEKSKPENRKRKGKKRSRSILLLKIGGRGILWGINHGRPICALCFSKGGGAVGGSLTWSSQSRVERVMMAVPIGGRKTEWGIALHSPTEKRTQKKRGADAKKKSLSAQSANKGNHHPFASLT